MSIGLPYMDEHPSHIQLARNTEALDEGVRRADLIHTSLAGMTAIVFMLVSALALPVFGHSPVTHPVAFWVLAWTTFTGIVGLYWLNFRVHRHVTDQARLTEVLVNSLGQGFAVFGPDGLCGMVYSQACRELLETVPVGQHIADVLRIPPEQHSDFKDWLDVLFQPDSALGFDDIIRFFPSVFPHSNQRRVTLVYRPITDKHRNLVSVVLIATDQTEEFAARAAVKRQQNFAEMICRIFKDRNQFQSSIAHVRDFLEHAQKDNVSIKDSSSILRELHTLKAAVKQFNLIDLGDVIHESENSLRDPSVKTDELFLPRLKESCEKVSESLARVTDEVSSLIGTEYEWRGNVHEIGEEDIYKFAEYLETEKVQETVIAHYLEYIAAVPMRDCLRSFERELRELAAIIDKQVKPIKFLGSNPRVLTRPIQELLFSFTHICRNIVDHGIETPVTRMARGKDPSGQVTITSDLLPDPKTGAHYLQIIIADDGNGIDPSRIRAKLASTDPEGAWRFEDDQAVIQRILSWGFTTQEKVTLLSGRGVGLEAVESEVSKLGGTIHVSSELYRGTRFDIRVPYCMGLACSRKKS